ncbi:MAG: sugar transferase [Proteobacteria bacterium]|nr:sugar transferase [Pseudomonadota bacterium]
MKRAFDFLISFFAIVFLLPLLAIISIAIKLTSPGPVLYWSDRVGKNNILFKMPKFRTMAVGTPSLPTRHMRESKQYITPLGSFLRKTSLDEIPQFWCILKGDMSFVGPRPVLTNENDLLSLRTQKGIHLVIPGLTGWAQINGRDSVTTEQKVALEKEYIDKQTFLFDLYIFLRTIPKVLFKKDISH